MSVGYQSSERSDGIGLVTITSTSATCAGTDRSTIVTLTTISSVSGVSVTYGGINCTAIAGATVASGTTVVTMYVTDSEPPTGTQSASASWTGASNVTISFIQVDGVKQSAPVNNGTSTANSFTTTKATNVTSASGDLTVTANYCSASDSAQTSDKTQKTSDWACMDIGDGSGTQTHTWSHSATNMMNVGANFVVNDISRITGLRPAICL